MNSRERVLASISHKEPDGVPIDLGATPSSGISAIAYNNLSTFLNLWQSPVRVYDVVQQLAEPDEKMLRHFHVDAIDIGRTFTAESNWYDILLANGCTAQYPCWFKPTQQADGSCLVQDKDGTIIARMPNNGTFYDQCYFPYVEGYPNDFKKISDAMDKVLWAALVHSPWDHASEPDFWVRLRQKTLELRKRTDRALVVVCGCNLFEWGSFLRRLDNFLMDLYLEPVKVECLLDALMEIHLATLEKVCDAIGDLVDIIRFGDDLGIDQGPFMPPEMYRRFFKPRHSKLCEYVKQHSQMHTFLHSCGSIYSLMPDLIEAGFEIINPVQTNCKDMAPAKLKCDFGKHLTFWGGGCDTRSILNNSDSAEVKKHVHERLRIMTPGGGFVFAAIHNILPEVPARNIEAMFQAIREFNGQS